jgi:hypothetical protein
MNFLQLRNQIAKVYTDVEDNFHAYTPNQRLRQRTGMEPYKGSCPLVNKISLGA